MQRLFYGIPVDVAVKQLIIYYVHFIFKGYYNTMYVIHPVLFSIVG